MKTWLGLFMLVGAAAAQEVDSRAELIRQARREKAANLKPETPFPLERRLNKLEEAGFFSPKPHGLTARFVGTTDTPGTGGMPLGQGLTLGPQYLNSRIAKDRLAFRTSIAGSPRSSWVADAELFTRPGREKKLFFSLLAEHLSAATINYFGPGPDTREGSRAQYRLETNVGRGTIGYRPIKHLSLGATAGYLTTETGRGNDEAVGQAFEIFTDKQAPGIVDQTDFLVSGVFLQYDSRDNPFGARSGGNYLARFDNYDDQDLNRHNFRRLHLEAQQYIPFWQGRRVIALRARSVMTFTNGAGQTVPFYLQPKIGGSDDLRGFRNYRFYDDNHIVVNAEYRWEVFAGLDMAAFFDAGKVAPKRSQINFHDLESSAGFGFRFNGSDSLILRFDFGFSHEGYQFWLRVSNPF